ncbi:MAG: hypothetical protein U0636_11535 [Phycisphaerales bacterium]
MVSGAGLAAAAAGLAHADPPPASLVRPVPGATGSVLGPPAPPPKPEVQDQGAETVISGAVTGLNVRIQPASHPKLPSADDLKQLKVPLVDRNGVWQPGPEGTPGIALGDLRGPISSASAYVCSKSVLAFFRDKGIDGVVTRVVAPETGKSGDLVVAVMVGTVTGVRTRSYETDGSEKVNSPEYARIAARSPVVPAKDGDAATLLQQQMLEDYLSQLNRLPGRQVSSDIGPGDVPGTVLLDYLVQDRKPFIVQLQGSNTGTPANGRWIEQLGIIGTRLLGLDDVLDIRAATNTFQGIYSVDGSWEGRFGDLDALRWRVSGDWSQYDASDVGIIGNNFTGTTWGGGGALVWNCLQVHDFFMDLEGGARVWYSAVDQALGDRGSSVFLTPYVQLNFFQQTRDSLLSANVGLEWTGANGSPYDLEVMGRTNPSTEWWTFRGMAMYSVFLDGVFDPNAMTAVHQLTARMSWQYIPGQARATPVSQNIVGGFYTVRGYAQALAVGDNTVVGSLQYDFHLLRALPDSPAGELFGKPFRWTTETGTGMPPSWDISPHVFFDAGYTSVNGPTAGEVPSATLTAAGIGVTAMIGTDLSVTLDWGIALQGQSDLGVNAGDTQLWFVGSINF